MLQMGDEVMGANTHMWAMLFGQGKMTAFRSDIDEQQYKVRRNLVSCLGLRVKFSISDEEAEFDEGPGKRHEVIDSCGAGEKSSNFGDINQQYREITGKI